MNCYTCFIVTREDMPAMLAAAAAGHNDLRRVIALVNRWLAESEQRPKACRFMCATCDAMFDGNLRRSPAGFMVAFPTFEDGPGATSGLCADCCARIDDRVGTVTKWAREMWPDAQTRHLGTA